MWRVIGNKYNNVVELHETYPVPTLNCFNQNIASLYIFCKPTQQMEFERRHLADIQKHHGSNIKIFKFERPLTMAQSSTTLVSNLNNIQNVFMMHTRSQTDLDELMQNKETISYRVIYKIMFNDDKLRGNVVASIKTHKVTMYPDIEMFIPFDDECEMFLNHIFPTNRFHDNSKYTYMTVIPSHYMSCVKYLESFHGLIQLVNSRSISNNVMMINNREELKNPKIITDMFLNNVPIVDMFIGRVYEDTRCVEFFSKENEITFIMLKLYIFKRNQYIVFLNTKYQTNIKLSRRLDNIIECMNEPDLLTKFFNMYTNGLIFNILNMDIHFILSSQRYKSNSYTILDRIIYNNFWLKFAPHCISSEDGKCIQFNRNSIILFDDIDRSKEMVSNKKYIDKDFVYLPEMYGDSTAHIESSLVVHLQHIKPDKKSKYFEVEKLVNNNNNNPLLPPPQTMSAYELLLKIHSEEEMDAVAFQNNNDLILESIIELANKIRVPITLLYSLSAAQIAYRLIFYSSLRNGIFLILDRETKTPYFQHTHDAVDTLECLKHLKVPKCLKIYQSNNNDTDDATTDDRSENFLFQNLVKRFIPIHMTGNLLTNYFNYFGPKPQHQFPILASIVDNEDELLTFKHSVLWSRQHLFSRHSIVSFDFSLFYSTLVALFGLDFQNCAILYGFELKNFFYNIYPNEQIFTTNRLKLLRLPYTFIMDNDTLEIHDIVTFCDIGKLNNNACYVVIMRFVVSEMMQKVDENYKSLANVFYTNIIEIQRYRTRLTLHKNILNAICGMLSAYQINTTILNIVYALSRKLIMYTTTNCITCSDDTTTAATVATNNHTSFLEHVHNNSAVPPKNLISIESDSFTYIYKQTPFDYTKSTENLMVVEELRSKILKHLAKELATCTMFDEPSIANVLNLKMNFITGNLFQITSRHFYYISHVDGFTLQSNERNNKSVQQALHYLNNDRQLGGALRKNDTFRVSFLKRTFNFVETRRLLLWYLIQHARIPKKSNNNTDNSSSHGGGGGGGNGSNNLAFIKTLVDFVDSQQVCDRKQVKQHLNILLVNVYENNISDVFLNILCSSKMNMHFRQFTVPENYTLDFLQIPTEKRTLVHSCIRFFFKLYLKCLTCSKSASATASAAVSTINVKGKR